MRCRERVCVSWMEKDSIVLGARDMRNAQGLRVGMLCVCIWNLYAMSVVPISLL
jgi:hypothetical protein